MTDGKIMLIILKSDLELMSWKTGKKQYFENSSILTKTGG